MTIQTLTNKTMERCSEIIQLIDECIAITLEDIRQCKENIKAFNSSKIMDCRHLAAYAKQSIMISQDQLAILAKIRTSVNLEQEIKFRQCETPNEQASRIGFPPIGHI